MANRPIFIPRFEGDIFVEVKPVEFKWYPGYSFKQKQKSIVSLHEAAKNEFKTDNILEISTKSANAIGVQLSAFNLTITTKIHKRTFSVESAFQSSKVFERGGPFVDLLEVPSNKAKKDSRLRESGRLKGFKFFNEEWPLEPKTIFYDWLYLNALMQNEDLTKSIPNYQAFTDIEFNPKKSLNCQAYSAALFCSLKERSLIEKALISKDSYERIIKGSKNIFQQLSLFS